MTLIRKYQKKIYRLCLGRKFNHRSSAAPSFGLKIDTCRPGATEVLWRGKVIAQTQPYSALPKLVSTDLFLIATGPSLVGINLKPLTNRIIFGVNGAVALQMQSSPAPLKFQYHMVTDPDFFENRLEMVRKMVRSNAHCFFSFQGLSILCQTDPTLLNSGRIYLTEVLNRKFHLPQLEANAFDRWADNNPDLLLHPTIRGQQGRIGFSKRLDQGVFCGRTITYRAIQAAYWLGFRRVYILGMDLGYVDRQSRFYETDEVGRPSKLEKDYTRYIEPSFEVLYQFVQSQKHFQVFNCSPTSRLPERLMPKITFEQAIRETDSTRC